MRPSFFKRVKRAIKQEFRRIKDEHRSTGRRRRKLSLLTRTRRSIKKIKEWKFKRVRKRPVKSHLPPLSKRIKHYSQHQWDKYRVVFSSKYLIITLNSTLLYLVSFFLIHFLTHLVTGITAWFCEISTTLNYTFVDFHIRYWSWTTEMVILVFSVPAFFAILIALLSSLAFEKNFRGFRILKQFRYLTKKQRFNHRRQQRHRNLNSRYNV